MLITTFKQVLMLILISKYKKTACRVKILAKCLKES